MRPGRENARHCYACPMHLSSRFICIEVIRMDLHQLRTFVAIADSGGVARAAQRLNLSQPAASRQIQALEADLGVLLFDRIGRRMRLTSEAEDLVPRARRLLAEAQSLRERARALQ